MAEFIIVDDLPTAIQAAELVDSMVAGANAKASRVAPCLVEASAAPTPTDAQSDALAEARLVLIGAVKRWAEAGSGALQSQSAGIFAQTVDTRQRGGFNLWPSEISGLQDICKSLSNVPNGGAFSVDTIGGGTVHLPWCDLMFNGTSCSCGVDIAGYPIFEQG